MPNATTLHGGNERGAQEAVAACGAQRDQLYVTSKVANNNHRPHDVLAMFCARLLECSIRKPR